MDAIDAEIEVGKQETYAKAKVEWAFLQGPILNRNEKRTGECLDREGLLYMPDAEGVYRYVTSTWTVTVWQRILNSSSKDWAVQGHEHHIPGLVSQLRSFSTLAKARDEAERLFATLTGSLRIETWPWRMS